LVAYRVVDRKAKEADAELARFSTREVTEDAADYCHQVEAKAHAYAHSLRPDPSWID
jgi:hypothetical protein